MTSPDIQRGSCAADIQLRAAEWIMERYEAGLWSNERQQALDAWLAQSPNHLLAYWRLKAAWERTHRLAALRTASLGSNRVARPSTKWPFAFKLVAATAVLAMIGGWLVVSSTPKSQERTYATPVGGHETITLADGSRVELNTATEIRVYPEGRLVQLVRGEAYFQVHHDSLRTFTVLASGHRVTDLGTKFLMREDGHSLQVTLLEGSVRFESANRKTRTHSEVLKPGDVAIATADSVFVTQRSLHAIADETAWRTGMLVFRDATLAEAVAEFNRYNSEQMVVNGNRAAHVKIDGAFHAANVAGFTNMAEHVFGLEVRKHGDQIAISD
jgi:transmembrane sensor